MGTVLGFETLRLNWQAKAFPKAMGSKASEVYMKHGQALKLS